MEMVVVMVAVDDGAGVKVSFVLMKIVLTHVVV